MPRPRKLRGLVTLRSNYGCGVLSAVRLLLRAGLRVTKLLSHSENHMSMPSIAIISIEELSSIS